MSPRYAVLFVRRNMPPFASRHTNNACACSRRRSRKTFTASLSLFALFFMYGRRKIDRTLPDIPVLAQSMIGTGCHQLGINDILRVRRSDSYKSTRKSDGLEWRSGFYDYAQCRPQRRGLQSGFLGRTRIAVLMPVDRSYESVIFDWSSAVHRAELGCFALTLTADTCVVVETHGCRCIHVNMSETNVDSNMVKGGWHGMRVAAVKLRFLGALSLLQAGYDVIMHDADVFFTLDSLLHVLSYLSEVTHSQPDLDFVAQDNGVRRVPYDRLNWGFVWLRQSTVSLNILRCTLERWDDEAFMCEDRTNCDLSYQLRSQPRINHIVEDSIVHDVARPSMCLISSEILKSFGIKHMTGYTNAFTKQTCAKADGYLKLGASAHQTLAYHVPVNATATEQKTALLTALAYARVTQRHLEIPRAYFRGRIVPFCLLYEIKDEPIHDLLSPHFGSCDDGTEIHDLHQLLVSPPWKLKDKRICIRFADLLNSGFMLRRKGVHKTISLCDPTNVAYSSLHMCQRSDGDEIKVGDER